MVTVLGFFPDHLPAVRACDEVKIVVLLIVHVRLIRILPVAKVASLVLFVAMARHGDPIVHRTARRILYNRIAMTDASAAAARYSIGFDFGTESVRVIVANVRNGHIAGQASRAYGHGVIDRELPTAGGQLPPDYALQHPGDWLTDSAAACRNAMRDA